MQIFVKNLTGQSLTYFGIIIQPQETKELFSQGVSFVDLLNDESLIPDWSRNFIEINDGNQIIQTSNQLIALTKGSFATLRTTDNRIITKPNVRPIGTRGYFSSRDDLLSNPVDVGNGTNVVKLDHKINQNRVVTISQQFNVEGNPTWLHEGFLKYQGAHFDQFCFYISTVITPHTPGNGTNFQLLPSHGIIIPAAGNGNAVVNTSDLTTLVSVVPRTDSGIFPAAFWNATSNRTTGKYENLTPAPTGNGRYNIFYIEVILKRYLNDITLLGTDLLSFETTDPTQLASNLKCNYMFTTVGDDHNWQAVCYISMYRRKIA